MEFKHDDATALKQGYSNAAIASTESADNWGWNSMKSNPVQLGLFEAAEVSMEKQPEHQPKEGGSIPTPALQAQQLRLAVSSANGGQEVRCHEKMQ